MLRNLIVLNNGTNGGIITMPTNTDKFMTDVPNDIQIKINEVAYNLIKGNEAIPIVDKYIECIKKSF